MRPSLALSNHREAIRAIALRHRVTNVRVFGSVVRGEERADSDIDFLIHIKEWKGLGNYARFADSLENMLGRKVDLVMEKGLSPHIAAAVLAEAQAI
jgi:predicted nucleotidyltransferase